MAGRIGMFAYAESPKILLSAAGEIILYDDAEPECCYIELRLCSTLLPPAGGPTVILLSDIPTPFTHFNYSFKTDAGQCVFTGLGWPICDPTGYTIYTGTHTPIVRCDATCEEGEPAPRCLEVRLCADDSLVGYVRDFAIYAGLVYKMDPLALPAETCVYLVVTESGCPEDEAEYLNTVGWEGFADCATCGVEDEGCPPCSEIEGDLPASISAGSVTLGDTCVSNPGTLFKGTGCNYSGAITWNCSDGRTASGTITLVRETDGSWTLTISHTASSPAPPFHPSIPSTSATYEHVDPFCSPNGEYVHVSDDGVGGWPPTLEGFISM